MNSFRRTYRSIDHTLYFDTSLFNLRWIVIASVVYVLCLSVFINPGMGLSVGLSLSIASILFCYPLIFCFEYIRQIYLSVNPCAFELPVPLFLITSGLYTSLVTAASWLVMLKLLESFLYLSRPPYRPAVVLACRALNQLFGRWNLSTH